MVMRGELNSAVNRIEALERQIRKALADIASLERKVQDLENPRTTYGRR